MRQNEVERRSTSLGLCWITASLFSLLALPSPSCAQSVQGQLLESGTGLPVQGALVLLLDERGRELGGYLTNDAGGFRLQAPGPGRYTVRSERIGLQTVTSDPFELARGQTLNLRLETAHKAIELEELRVEGERQCVVRPEEGVLLAQIWEEVRKALTVQEWTDQEGLNRYRVLGYERDLDPQTRLAVTESRRFDEWVTRNPIRSLPVEDLLKGGFIQRDESGGYTYYGPDATVLLSDAFLDTHCFGLEIDDRRPGMLGLSFKPVRRSRLPDITGTLWLDTDNIRLQFLEFGYTWSPWLEAIGVAEGRVQFEGMPDGSWIVRRWWIRMPKMVRDNALMTGGQSGFRVARITEAGGEVARISSPGYPTMTEAAVGTLTGLVWDSTQAGPLVGATVYLSGTQYSAVTDSAGFFLLADVPEGFYRATFRHPQVDSLGVFPSGVEVSIDAGGASETALAVPSRVSILKALCSEAGWEAETSAVVGTVWDGENGNPVSGATVVLEWTDYRTVANREILADVQSIEVLTDERGRYRACGVSSLVIITAQAKLSDSEGAKVRAIVPEENVMVLDLELNSNRANPSGRSGTLAACASACRSVPNLHNPPPATRSGQNPSRPAS